MPPRNKRRAAKRDGSPPLLITVDGDEYRLDMTEVTHRHELELWKATGLTVPEIASQLESDVPFPPFMLGALMLLSLRTTGDTKTTYDKVTEKLSWSSSARIAVEEPPAEDDSGSETAGEAGPPEAPAAD